MLTLCPTSNKQEDAILVRILQSDNLRDMPYH